jgi:hypothetical protein
MAWMFAYSDPREVLEVYSGPPTVSFRWRHWGTMKNDYVGFDKYVPSHADSNAK